MGRDGIRRTDQPAVYRRFSDSPAEYRGFFTGKPSEVPFEYLDSTTSAANGGTRASGARKRRRELRPANEWISKQDERLRIGSDELFAAAQRYVNPAGRWTKAGGKPKYLLSGLLKCDVCGGIYILGDRWHYACTGYIDGAACGNGVRVRRDHVERVLLDPIKEQPLAPARVKRMATEPAQDYEQATRRGLPVPRQSRRSCKRSTPASLDCASGSDGATRT
jgi:Recombinase zinc beta ribbon domain